MMQIWAVGGQEEDVEAGVKAEVAVEAFELTMKHMYSTSHCPEPAVANM